MKNPPTEDAEQELCPNCGTIMVTTDGETYCPRCANEIDWGLGDEEDGE